ncbi:hypothetical protein CYMTET_52358 [Cymbomonas tetramitiformis]|uniref:Uncharacterized protein n=1 Tax=Cymbomonas tetramitiformis TaxID=36881 RepID=A0AAE0ERF1_9CHLO|nr:hypothetical protein CYMTET_52358 [Cymbomonas tetramitiformis]
MWCEMNSLWKYAPYLRVLHDNSITGPLPTELGLLTSLQDLYLNDNSITGPLPTELGLLTSLQDLDVGDNSITGRLPTELNQLKALTFLSVIGVQSDKRM